MQTSPRCLENKNKNTCDVSKIDDHDFIGFFFFLCTNLTGSFFFVLAKPLL